MNDFKSDYDTGYADGLADFADGRHSRMEHARIGGKDTRYWKGYIDAVNASKKKRDEARDEARPWQREVEALSGEVITAEDFPHIIGVAAGKHIIKQGMIVVRNVDGSIGPYVPTMTPPAIGFVMTRRRGWVELYGPIIVLALYMIFRLTGSVPQ